MSPQPDPAALAQLQSRLLEIAAKAHDHGWYTEAEECRAAATALGPAYGVIELLEHSRAQAEAERDTAQNLRAGAFFKRDIAERRIDELLARISELEADREAHAEALKAMTAERNEAQRQVEWLKAIGMPHARAQSNADGFQKGWHAALDCGATGDDTIEDLRALVPQPPAESQVAALTAEIAQPHETKDG